MSEVAVYTLDPRDFERVADWTAPHLRMLEQWELHFNRKNPAKLLADCCRRTVRPQFATIDDEPAAIWGVVDSTEDPELGLPWMFVCDSFGRDTMLSARIGRQIFADEMKRFERLEGMVWADDALAIKWLRFVRFNVDPAEAPDRNGMIYRRFWQNVHADHANSDRRCLDGVLSRGVGDARPAAGQRL